MVRPRAQSWTHDYTPRSYFKAFHSRVQRYALLVVHRQAGKSHAVAHDMIARALFTQKKGWRGAYIAPFLKQARNAIWKKLLSATANFPGVKVSKAELSITFPNGSVITIYGADNAEALRGDTLDYACLDEFGDMHPQVLSQVVGPMLMVRKGHLVIIGTPKGSNHFYKQYLKAQGSPKKWFCQLTTIEDTKDEAISYDEQATKREDMEDPEWNQEMLCSFTAEFRGTYYAKHLELFTKRQGFRKLEHNPLYPVHAAMDVGYADELAIWFWQYIGGEARIIDYFASTGMDAEQTCDFLEVGKPYHYAAVWLPHDAYHHTFASAKSAYDTFQARGLPAVKVPNPDKGNSVFHGIDAVRKVLRLYAIAIDPTKCAGGIECLRNYSRQYNKKTNVYVNKPDHNEWSHGADAFRYLCLSLDTKAIHDSKPLPTNKYAHQPVGPSLSERLKRYDSIVADRQENYYRIRNG